MKLSEKIAIILYVIAVLVMAIVFLYLATAPTSA